ncbi:hypothetical protein BFW01_g7396 [Lasiodiplodia theobromae]|nr:hypothetical protein BFW01_g7396 [Lasiodiplodia theobromae]
MIKTEHQDDEDNKPTQPIIIQPLSTTSLPPATPESSIGVNPGSDACSGSGCHHQPIYLPPLEHASACVQRYFDEVHCLYWLFSTEQFHERVHETYLTGGVLASASWLCCLYCVFAIGSAGDTQTHGQQKTSTEYLVMAKALVPQVVDEADVDSVRALTYLYIGTAVRTAYSLGMHVEKAAPPSRGRLEREQNRRIWWTLYLLDYEIAHRYGNPCAVVEEVHDIQVQMPSEQILSPGPNTPPNYLAAASSLCTISRRIRSTLHQHRQNNPSSSSPSSSSSTSNPTISTSTIRTLLAALNSWHASLPAHLSALSHTAPAHRRAVGILHLQYWANVVLVTRPFLLYRALLRKWRGRGRREEEQRATGDQPVAAAYGRSAAGGCGGDGEGEGEKGEKKCCGGATGSKRRLFAEMAETCTAAARSGLDIMMTMMVGGGAGGETAAGSLSSLVNFDCSNLLELVQVFRLAMLLEEREADGSDQSSPFSEMPPCDYCSGGGAGGAAPPPQQQQQSDVHTTASTSSAAAENDWRQRIHEALAIMRAMEPVGWTARALPELEVQMRECGILVDGDGCDDGGGVEFMAPPLGMEEMMREAMVGQRDGGGSGGVGYGGVERMDVEDTLGAFFGDVLGEGAAGGGFGAFGDTYNNVLFLDVDFT